MRTLGFSAVTAAPDLGIFRKIAAGERVRMWAGTDITGQASVIATLGKVQLCNTPLWSIPNPTAAATAGSAVNAANVAPPTAFLLPLFDFINTRQFGGGVDAELFLSWTFGTAKVNLVIGVDP